MAEQVTIQVNARHSPLAWLLYLTKITIEVDGAPQKGSWGDRTVSVAPGQHNVAVYFKYLTKARCCEASMTVDAAEGQTVALDYRTPVLMTAPGKLTKRG